MQANSSTTQQLQLMEQKMRRVQQLAAHLTTATAAAAEPEADGAPVPLTDEEVRASTAAPPVEPHPLIHLLHRRAPLLFR